MSTFIHNTMTLLLLRVAVKMSSQTVLLLIKPRNFSFNTKCLHLFTTYWRIVTLVPKLSLQPYAVKKKNNLTITFTHTYLHIEVRYTCFLIIEKLNTESSLAMFPKHLSLLLVPHSCASHSTTSDGIRLCSPIQTMHLL